MLLAEAERRLELVLAADAQTFPWVALAPLVRARPVHIGDTGPLPYEGMTALGVRYGRFGRSPDGKPVIGVLNGHRVDWFNAGLGEVAQFGPEHVSAGEPPAPDERDQRALEFVGRYGIGRAGLSRADDVWLAWWWPSFRCALHTDRRYHPVAIRDAQGTRLVDTERVAAEAWGYPPDRDGYARFVEEAPTNPDLSFTDADVFARTWWGRSLRRDAFARVRGPS